MKKKNLLKAAIALNFVILMSLFFACASDNSDKKNPPTDKKNNVTENPKNYQSHQIINKQLPSER